MAFLGGTLGKDSDNSLLLLSEKRDNCTMLVSNDRSIIVDFAFLRPQVWPSGITFSCVTYSDYESIHVAALSAKGNLIVENISKNKYFSSSRDFSESPQFILLLLT